MRALVPLAVQMMVAGALPATCPKMPPEQGRRKLQSLRIKTMWQLRMRPLPRRKWLRRNIALLLPPSQAWSKRFLQREFQCLRPEHLLKSLWDLNPKRLLHKGRRGRRGSKRPLLECLGDPQ